MMPALIAGGSIPVINKNIETHTVKTINRIHPLLINPKTNVNPKAMMPA